MKIFILFGAFIPLVLTTLLFTDKRKIYANRFLMIWLMLHAVAFFLVYLSEETGNYGWSIFLTHFNLISTPFFYFYIFFLLNPNKKIRVLYYINFAPYIIGILYFLSFIGTLPELEFEQHFNLPFFKRNQIYILFELLDTLSIPLYALISYSLLKNHNEILLSHLSNTDGIDHKWLRVLTLLLVCFWLIIYPQLYINYFTGISSEETIIRNSFILMSVIVFAVGIYGLKKTNVFVQTFALSDTTLKMKYKKSGLANNEAQELFSKLNILMQTNKYYLNPTISLTELANELSVSSHNLSQILNEQARKNFYEFINDLRIKHFIETYNPKKNSTSILSHAYECGFNSKSAFNRAFKKVTNKTPTLYYKSA